MGGCIATSHLRAPLLITCGLWLYAYFRIKAGFRRNAYCLSRKTNAESGVGVKPRRARSEAPNYRVAALKNGTTILLRTTPCNCKPQITQRLQSINSGALYYSCNCLRISNNTFWLSGCCLRHSIKLTAA